MSVVLNQKALDAVAEAAAQILGPEHPLVGEIQQVKLDPDAAHVVWSAIEGLPDEHRKALAGLVAAYIMPGLNPANNHRH